MGWFVVMMEGSMVIYFTRDPALQVSVLQDCFQDPEQLAQGQGRVWGSHLRSGQPSELPFPQSNCCSRLWQSVQVCELVFMRSRGTCVSVGGGACAPIYECKKISKLYNTLLMKMLIH